jgi:hypothetical protein
MNQRTEEAAAKGPEMCDGYDNTATAIKRVAPKYNLVGFITFPFHNAGIYGGSRRNYAGNDCI